MAFSRQCGRTAPGHELEPPLPPATGCRGTRKAVPESYWTFQGGVVRSSSSSSNRLGGQPPARSSSCKSQNSNAPTSARSCCSQHCTSPSSGSSRPSTARSATNTATSPWMQTRADRANTTPALRTPRHRRPPSERQCEDVSTGPDQHDVGCERQSSPHMFHPPTRGGLQLQDTTEQTAGAERAAKQDPQQEPAGKFRRGTFSNCAGLQKKRVLWSTDRAGSATSSYAGKPSLQMHVRALKPHVRERDHIEDLIIHKVNSSIEEGEAKGLAVVVNNGEYHSFTAACGMATGTWAETGRIADDRCPVGVSFASRKKLAHEAGVSLRNASGELHSQWAQKHMRNFKEADPSASTRGLKHSTSGAKHADAETPRPLRKTEQVWSGGGGPHGEPKSGSVGSRKGYGTYFPTYTDPITSRHLDGGQEHMDDTHLRSPSGRCRSARLHLDRRVEEDPRPHPFVWDSKHLPRDVADKEYRRYVKAGGQYALTRRAQADVKGGSRPEPA